MCQAVSASAEEDVVGVGRDDAVRLGRRDLEEAQCIGEEQARRSASLGGFALGHRVEAEPVQVLDGRRRARASFEGLGRGEGLFDPIGFDPRADQPRARATGVLALDCRTERRFGEVELTGLELVTSPGDEGLERVIGLVVGDDLERG